MLLALSLMTKKRYAPLGGWPGGEGMLMRRCMWLESRELLSLAGTCMVKI